MSNTAWLFVAFAIVWVAIGAYLWSLGSRQKRLEQRLEDLAHRGSQTHNL